MREFEAWLLDADYVTRGGGAVVRLWVREGNEVFPVFDDSFEPYFYCVSSGNAGDAAEALRDLDVRDVSVVERRILGEPVEVVRVVAGHPQDVPELRNRAGSMDEVDGVREAKIPFATRYVVDRGLVPAGMHRFSVEDRDGEDFLDSAEPVDSEELPDLDVLAFDCEMLSDGTAPDPGEDPIVVISVAMRDGTELFTADDGEEEMIRDFLSFLDGFDPDVVATYNGDGFDWPYLRDRAEECGVELRVGRDGSEPVFRDGGRGNVDVRGRLNVDLYRVAERDLGNLKTKSLEDVAEHLGVVDRADRASIDSIDIRSYWDEDGDGDRGELLEYAAHDAESTLGIAEELLPLQLQLSRLVHRFPDDVSKMGRGRQVEWFLVSEARDHGEIVPSPEPSERGYAGGLVLEPETGLHEDVVCLDFSSMYPSIMIAYNVSPDTLVGEEYGREVHESPGGHRFRAEPDGFFKRVLEELLEARSEAKRRRREAEPGSREAALADLRQRTLKVLANSFYGYTGWPAASWYRQECAEATAAWGREMIRRAVDEAESRGYEVLYGDTDSLFLKGPSEGGARDFAGELTDRLPLELEVEDFYEVIFFTEVKKRYAGLTEDGRLEVKGLEVQRGDWCDLAREVQSTVLEKLLRERDPGAAASYVRETVERLKGGEIPLGKLVIRKTLTKRIESYKSVQAHVRAAERLIERGVEVSPGEKVGFVVVRGGGNLSDRAYPVEMFEGYKDGYLVGDSRRYELDTVYYVEKQAVPAAHRILKHFGFSEGYLKGQPRQSTFEAF